ncbi:hypothetical protein ACCP91_10450 [Xanthomonas axonopodis pv. cyamopsidis]|uniref:hypothetical protein n=1 Tax=Xanthomonas axonopodis TaxID=53413 RepID=UPI003558D236
MSRPTDSERGARIAIDIATVQARQLPLFESESLSPDFWNTVYEAAVDELLEISALRSAVGAR